MTVNSTAARSMDARVQDGLGRWLLIAVLVELLLGGNGYLTEIVGVRFRVLLSALCIVWALTRLFLPTPVKLPRQIVVLSLLFGATLSIGILVGLLRGSQAAAMAAELKPLMYFPMILFFAVVIKSWADISLVARLIVACGVAQAVTYLALMASAHAGAVAYSTIYLYLKQSDEFIFRHSPEDGFFLGFFYKGAFHLAVAALFLLLHPRWKNKWLAAVVIAAFALSLTRGLIAALLLSLAVGPLLVPTKNRVAMLLLAVIVATTLILTSNTSSLDIWSLVERPTSDDVRLADLDKVKSEIDTPMLLYGRGLGAPVGDRDRIEMTYVEVLYKQGIIGLSLWIAILLVNLRTFYSLQRAMRQRALPFLLASGYVYASTATNTFLTGSIGMSIVLISTVVLLAMKRLQWNTQDKPCQRHDAL